VRELIDAGALVDRARALVAVDSQNPPGRERAVADVARQLLEPLGATFTEVEPEPGRVSVIAAVDGDSRSTLIVNGHLDVVPVDPTAWTHDPWGCELEGGRLYGRGTADMKGGIAAAIEAVAALRRHGIEPNCNIAFHLVADEEAGGACGAGALLAKGLIVGDACIDPEPTSMGVCIAERGFLRAAVHVRGIPAHGSEPRRGVSAIEKAAKIVLALHAADFGDAHPLLGSPSCNAGMISGGSAYNVVAETCTVNFDRRLLPGISAEAALRSLTERIDAIDDPELRYAIEVASFGEASELDRADAFLAVFQKVYEQELSRPGLTIGLQAFTDARFIRNEAGIPTVVCGPGELEQAHRVDESVAIDALVDAAAVYAQLFATYGG
jgi:succinyl-diaminopimelate desuccinylase